MRTFVLGDIHGGYKALVQVLKRAKFSKKKDRLIILGDVCDGWSEVKECMDFLMELPNLVFIRGNHDELTLCYYKEEDHYLTEKSDEIWLKQGGKATLKSLGKNIGYRYIRFLESSIYYFEEEGRLFVHAAAPYAEEERMLQNLEHVSPHTFAWSRDMVRDAWNNRDSKDYQWGTKWKEIYVGHTPTTKMNSKVPLHLGNVIMMDTGAAFLGKLSLMNVETKELFQSDPVYKLYPKEKGRN